MLNNQSMGIKRSLQLSRRDALKIGALAGAGALIVVETGCGPKVSFYVQTIKGALIELQPLLPGSAVLLAKGIAIADDFDSAYRKGDFSNAITILQTLADNIGQIAKDAAGSNPQIEGIIAIAGIALRTVAAILAAQTGQPAVVAARKTASAAEAKAASTVERLGDAKTIRALFLEAQP